MNLSALRTGDPVEVTRRPIEVICECGINHNGDMDLARAMIAIAANAGADVAKFQVYDPETLLDSEHPQIKPWWDVIIATKLTPEDVAMLKAECDRHRIKFMASVFDVERIAWTEAVGMARYKIASRSLYDEALAEAIKATGKPVLRSWGSFDGRRAPDVGWDVTELYCIAEYPAPLEHIDVNQLHKFARGGYPPYKGFSDHTIGLSAAAVAMAYGAQVIEKHFTLDRNLPGPDQACSILPDELRTLCKLRDGIEALL